MDRERELEAAAILLTDSGDYRVLRRVHPQRAYATGIPKAGLKQALLVDLETTGLDTAHDVIIEFGAVPFHFDADGRVFDVGEPVSYFEDPGRPIPPDVQELTGITDAMVQGQRIDDARVIALIDASVLVIAHNARFDRPIAERRLPNFIDKHWGCSCDDVPWPAYGGQTRKLNLLLHTVCDAFHDGHRAVDDCLATVHLLAQPVDGEGKTPMAFLLDAARRKTHRIWARRSPFDTKDVLKARGYRWSAEQKTWYVDRGPDDADAERAWLNEFVYRIDPAPPVTGTLPSSPIPPSPIEVQLFTAKERYSVRAELAR